MNATFLGKAVAAAALFVCMSHAAPTAAAERLPKAFYGAWTSDLTKCEDTGESTPMTVDAKGILEYETGFTIRSWSKSGDVWIGRGKQVDDQGSMPATIRLRLRTDGTLNFSSAGKGSFPDEPGLLRCPASTAPRR